MACKLPLDGYYRYTYKLKKADIFSECADTSSEGDDKYDSSYCYNHHGNIKYDVINTLYFCVMKLVFLVVGPGTNCNQHTADQLSNIIVIIYGRGKPNTF